MTTMIDPNPSDWPMGVIFVIPKMIKTSSAEGRLRKLFWRGAVEFHEEFTVGKMNFGRNRRGAEKGLVVILGTGVAKWRRADRRNGRYAHLGTGAEMD
jgi:hypothetical protein